VTTALNLRTAATVLVLVLAGGSAAHAKAPKAKTTKFEVIGQVVRLGAGEVDVCVGNGPKATKKASSAWAGHLVTFTTSKRLKKVAVGSWVKARTRQPAGTGADDGPFAAQGPIKAIKFDKKGKKRASYGAASCPGTTVVPPPPVIDDKPPKGPSGDNG
jgi:hypothetical protein